MTDFKAITATDADYILWQHLHDFGTEPRLHQKVTLIWALAKDRRRLCLWHDIGTGKTLTALYLHQLWDTEKLLVVCPNSVLETWEQQIPEHTKKTFTILRGMAAERRALIGDDAAIHVVNYEGLLTLFGKRIKRKLVDGKWAKAEWHMARKTMRDAGYDGIILDESHHLKSPDALQTKAAAKLSEYAENVVIMTGSPILTSEADVHSQYLVLDGGRTLGASRRKFLEKHFEQDHWGKWWIRPGEYKRIVDRVAPVTISFSREECCDMPEIVYEERYYDMTAEQRKFTKQVIDGARIELAEGGLSPQDAMQRGNKLAQIAGGTMLLDDGVPHHFEKNPKLDALVELVREVPGKIIVFHHYVEEGRIIGEWLAYSGIDTASLRGEISEENRRTGLEEFRTDPTCRVLVAHPRSGGEGLNLQEAATVIFYGPGMGGAAVREQAIGRIWRMGQRRRCLVVDLLMRDSVDCERLDKLRDRAEMSKKVLRYIERWKG